MLLFCLPCLSWLQYMVENENKNWYLPDFWNKKCDFSYFCWSQIFHLRNEDAGLDCEGPFLFRHTWGKKREVGSRRGQKENSISFNKACSQGGHFPFSINPCPSWGHFHPDVPPIVFCHLPLWGLNVLLSTPGREWAAATLPQVLPPVPASGGPRATLALRTPCHWAWIRHPGWQNI